MNSAIVGKLIDSIDSKEKVIWLLASLGAYTICDAAKRVTDIDFQLFGVCSLKAKLTPPQAL